MARVTSKLQVTVPKAIADHFGIRPGDDIDWVPAGDVIRVVPPRQQAPTLDRETRLSLFDAATARQKRRQGVAGRRRTMRHRGWRREDLYTRGCSR
jgi:AbrB family looped-hinge helix DNA binding protein